MANPDPQLLAVARSLGIALKRESAARDAELRQALDLIQQKYGEAAPETTPASYRHEFIRDADGLIIEVVSRPLL